MAVSVADCWQRSKLNWIASAAKSSRTFVEEESQDKDSAIQCPINALTIHLVFAYCQQTEQDIRRARDWFEAISHVDSFRRIHEHIGRN